MKNILLFRSRIDDIIDKKSASLKSQISEQVSKASTAVTSNVKDYLDTIKEETVALNAIVLEELNDVANTISQNLPFIAGLKSGNTIEANVFENNLRDAVFSEHTKRSLSKEADQECDKVNEEDPKLSGDENSLRHDPLFPPGRILYLNRVIAQGPLLRSDDENGIAISDELNQDTEVVEFVEVGVDNFGQVELSTRMLLDHLCTDYERVLQLQAERQDSIFKK